MSEKLRVVVKEVGKKAKVEIVENTLEAFQEVVDGYIEILPLNSNLVIVLNEEGKLLDLETNITISNGSAKDNLVGNILFVNTNNDLGTFESITDENLDFLEDMGLRIEW